MPQKNWATMAMNTRSFAVPSPTALEINRGAALTRNGSSGPPKAIGAYRSGFSGIACVIERLRKKAAIADT